MTRRILTLFPTVAFVLCAATVHAQGATPAAQQSAPQQTAPEIYFRAPAENAEVGSPFVVAFGLRNYGVAPATVNFPRTGHFHILINVEPPAPGVVIPADSQHLHFGLGQIETQLRLAPGSYTLRLVLADHEHKVIGPELVSRPLRVTVRGK